MGSSKFEWKQSAIREQSRHHFLLFAGREIHVVDWGRIDAEPVILWHGFARTSRDFDTLAHALSDTYRLLAPDTLGRGLSQWAVDPGAEYSLSFHIQVAEELCAVMNIARLRWVGTSVGGALGIALGGGKLRERISHLVVNDIGPEVPRAAAESILAYVGAPRVFERITELETYLRTIYSQIGFLSDAEWRQMAMTSARRRDDGRLALHYDPRIVEQFMHGAGELVQWDAFRKIAARTLVLRGGTSNLLLSDIAERMKRERPDTQLIEIAGCGHAPSLNVPEQIEIVRHFLAA